MADYVVIAISPALIMALVGSLVFFLLRVFYQGDFQVRLHWVMACFVFAAVLIGRISIVEGLERAMMFGAALAIVIGIAANRFMEFHGGWIEHFSWAINWSLIALVWWCAHRLIWDCTLIDDSQDSSGEGLLQVAGLEKPDGANESDTLERRLEGTTSRQVPSGFWQRYVEHQRRPHAPGVWVVYFSLAALPLFGIGQWLIPESDVMGRRYAFWLLSIYVASGLGLLLTTSFLGLRRYLRQRRIEMPTLMANLWLGTGAVVIGILLVLAALLPRPSAEYAISRLPFAMGSPEQKSSRMAPVSEEGTRDEQPGPAQDRAPQDDAEETKSPDTAHSGAQGTSTPSQDGKAPSSQGSSSQPDAPEQGSQSSKSSGQGKASSDDTKQAAGKQQSPQDDRHDAGKSQGPQDRERVKPTDRINKDNSQGQTDLASKVKRAIEERQRQAAQEASPPPQPPENPPQDSASTQPAEQQPATTPPSFQAATEAIAATTSTAAEMLRWAVYAAIVLGALYACWRFRAEIAATIREFLAALAEFWSRLTGGKRAYGIATQNEVEIKIPPAPFSSFADPFATGISGRYSIQELVRYSFDAFEAWGREHGCPREPDQTPHELARDVGNLNAFIRSDAHNLAELYARAAYARGELPPTSEDQLRQIWRAMRAGGPSSLAWGETGRPPAGQV
jgi:hypothetical protein